MFLLSSVLIVTDDEAMEYKVATAKIYPVFSKNDSLFHLNVVLSFF